MKTSKSNLLTYLGVLLSDDAALYNFLIDPITVSEGTYGITKAERSVLRRTVANLSNQAVNGFSIQRDLSSYRRSLRLLQNVLHNVGSKMVQDVMSGASNAAEQSSDSYTFSVIYNLPNVDAFDFTCQKDSAVDEYGGAYAWATPAYTVQLQNQNPTIQEVMDAVNEVYYATPVMPYSTAVVNGSECVIALTPLGVSSITADLSNPCYDLSKNPDADFVFWFYSINGRANKDNSGGFGTSFTEYTLSPNDTVYWQLIAPGKDYGFQKCKVAPENRYAALTVRTKTLEF